MTLIEILLCYREHVRQRGAQAGYLWLETAVEPELIPHLVNSVNGNGEFIDAEYKVINVQA